MVYNMNRNRIKFAVGDYVRIRRWDDMEREFGLTPSGNISCQCYFTTLMRDRGLNGFEFMISSIKYGVVSGHRTGYMISEDMLELVQDTPFDSEEIDSFLDTIEVK